MEVLEFVEKAACTHRGRYTYEDVKFSSTNDKITIMCKKHGKFTQKVRKHLEGNGCKKCAIEARKLTTADFIEKAKKVHGIDRYSYDLTNYTLSRNKIVIICNVHGKFAQTPNKHLSGRGCPECGNISISEKLCKPFSTFVSDARAIHGNTYDYIGVGYKNAKHPTPIICDEHGIFYQTPDNHLYGEGCPLCANITAGNRSRSSKKEFTNKAAIVHGGVYDYDNVIYTNNALTVVITCKIHGDFWQTPSNHLAGRGCRKCTTTGGGFDTTKAGTLYYIAIDGGTYYKIGITNRSVWARFSKDEHHRIRIVKEWCYPCGKDTQIDEAKVLQEHKSDLIQNGVKVLRNGNTEIFSRDVLGLDVKKLFEGK